MGLNNLGILTKMAFDKNVIKSLYKIYNILNEDRNFNGSKYLKMMSGMLKGEKIIGFEDKYIISPFMPPFPSKAFYTNIMATPEEDGIFTQQIYGRRSGPISFYLSLTNKCPNNCLYCSAKKRQDHRELTTMEWKNIINDIQDMNTSIIGLTGGEPMVREDIFDIVGSIDDRSVSTLFTSGYNLSPERAKELKKSGLFSIGVSLDSCDKDRHNQNRNSEEAFETSINAIQNSRQAGLYTMAQTVILKDEIDEEKLFEFFKFAGENGVHEVKILEPILSGSLLDEENPDNSNIFYSAEDRKKLISIQHKANGKVKLPKITSFAYTESEERFGCGAGTQHSYISASGHLYPCDFLAMSFGQIGENEEIGENSVEDLWQEMNRAIGKPKIGCFAQSVNKEVYEKANKELPLCKEESVEICQKHRSDSFPGYYRGLQG